MDQVFQAGEGAGRSGSFFFHTFDNRFVIKTMTQKEVTTFLKIAEDYARHYKRCPDSLIAKIFGVFKVNLDYTTQIYLMLMENTL